MHRISKSLRYTAFILALAGGYQLCSQTVWTSADSGDWAMAANWSAGVPTIDLAVTITNAGTKVITINAATPAANLAARRLDLFAPPDTTNTLRFDNLGNTPFQFTNSLNMDTGAQIEIINSTLSLDGTLGGSFNQFAGEVILAGGALVTTNGAGLRIGRVGVGRAFIASGTMAARSDLIVGDVAGSDGTLTLSNGLVQVDGELHVGDDPGSTGHIHVAGGTFIATNQTANSRIGDDGDGTFTITGGAVMMDGVSVGRSSGSTGRLLVRGGWLQPGSLSLGRFAGAQGMLEVTGGTLDLEGNSLYIGREGAGTMVISNGTVHAELVSVATTDTASGLLELHGGTLITEQFIATNAAGQIQFRAGRLETQTSTVANGAAFIVGDGFQSAVLHLDGGAHTFNDGLTISSNATLTGTGTIIGAITVLPGGSNQFTTAPSVALTPAVVNGEFRFQFSSVVGKSYDILSATNLAQPQWQLQATLAGNGDTLAFTNTAPGPQHFFRVLIH